MLILAILVLSLPIAIALFGFLLWKFPPKTTKVFYGYRSKRSVLSNQAWYYANSRAAEMMLKGSLIHLGVMILIVLIYRFGSEISDPLQMANNIAVYPLLILGAQVFYMAKRIDRELASAFDAKGRPVRRKIAGPIQQSK